jgi:O-antigen ligase
MTDRLYRFLLAFALPTLLGFAIVWKGGKGLDATWILAGTAWLLTLAHYRMHGRAHATPSTLWWTWLLFVGWTVVSYFLSSTRNYGLDEVLRDTSYFLLFGFVIRELQHAGSPLLRRSVKVVVWCAAIACVVGIAVYWLQPVNRFVGTFFDYRFNTDYWPNAWGDFVLLSWPLVLWASLMDRKGGIPNLRTLLPRLAGLGVLFGCFFLSYSRGSFLAFIGQILLLKALAYVFILYPLHVQSKRPGALLKHLFPPVSLRGGWRTGVTGFAVVLAVAAASFQGVNLIRSQLFPVQSVLEKATFTAAEGKSSVDERAQFWDQSYALSWEKPWFGWGPYSFRFVQPRLQQHVFATADHPHNVILKLAMERGWPAAILFAAIILLVLRSGISYLRSVRGSLRKTSDAVLGHALPLWSHALFVACALTAVTGTLVHSMIDFNLQFVGNGLLFWILCAAIVAFACAGQKSRTAKHVAAKEVVVATLLVLVAILEGRYLVTSSLGRHSEAAGDDVRAMAWYEYSKGEWFSRDLHLSRAHLLLKAGLPDASLRALEDAFAENAEDARAWLMKAEALKAKGDWPEAYEGYREAMALGEYNYMDATKGVMSVIDQTRDPKLLQNIDMFTGHLDDFAAAIEQNVHFIALTPNVERLAETLDILVRLQPQKAAEYRAMKKRVTEHAATERKRLQARTPGLLW